MALDIIKLITQLVTIFVANCVSSSVSMQPVVVNGLVYSSLEEALSWTEEQ